MEVSGYVFSSKHPEVTRVIFFSPTMTVDSFSCLICIQNQFLEGLLPIYRPATADELKICPGDWKYGAFFTTLVIESGYHLPWLSKK